jgi:hypothetical protein
MRKGTGTRRFYGIVSALSIIVILLFSAVYIRSMRSPLSQGPKNLSIDPQQVQAIAIYGEVSNFGTDLPLNQLNFSITDPSLIASLIASIEFTTERDCSEHGSVTQAYVYVKYVNGCVEVYELFALWSHFCKVGFWGSCYFVTESGQLSFEAHAQ